MSVRTHIPSPFGLLTLESDGEALTGLWLEGQAHHPGAVSAIGDCTVFRQTADWLDRYFRGLRPNPREIPLKFQGTPFRIAVWEALLQIPYGKTVTYGFLAKQLGCASARAVGQAVGHNPICILIPCHRVVGATGLTGYAGGLERKEFLLALEQKNSES